MSILIGLLLLGRSIYTISSVNKTFARINLFYGIIGGFIVGIQAAELVWIIIEKLG